MPRTILSEESETLRFAQGDMTLTVAGDTDVIPLYPPLEKGELPERGFTVISLAPLPDQVRDRFRKGGVKGKGFAPSGLPNC